MFEGFPYTNFHELNLDWIIKIAKDFLDQYTNIQQTITTGLEDLDAKAQQLEAALDAWYEEHSEDIAQELARALNEAITAFNAAADAKAAQTIASIPDDYTTLSTNVNYLKTAVAQIIQHEATSTATAAHSVGEYFISDLNNALYYVKSAIAIGDSISTATNVTNVPYTSVVNALVNLINNGDSACYNMINQIIAHEQTSTASRNYSIGEYFISDLNNALYYVKSAIAIGDSISTATNVTNVPYSSITNLLIDSINDLKTYTENALTLTEDVSIIEMDEARIYKNATVNNGSKTYTDHSVTFTTNTDNSTFNGVIHSANSTPLVLSENAYASENLTIEFDVVASVDDFSLRVYGGSGIGTKTFPNITTGHWKIEFPATYKNTVYFYRQANNTEETITVSNLLLYQGSKEKNPFAYVEYPRKYNKILTIGDSLTNINGNAGQGKERWQNVVIRKCGFDNYKTEGAVGYTVATFAGQTSIYEVVQELTTDSSVDFITFWGGTNDWSQSIEIGDFSENIVAQDNSTFYGALISCVKKLTTLYPGKRIVLIGTTPRMVNDTLHDWPTDGAVNNNGDTLVDFVNAVKTVAEYYGLPFLDLMHTSGINNINYATYLTQQQHTGDTFYYYLHFTDYGELQIGDTVSGFINGILGN